MIKFFKFTIFAALVLVASTNIVAQPTDEQTLELAFNAKSKGDYVTYFDVLNKLEETGDAEAKVYLAYELYTGDNVQEDKNLALKLGTESADAGIAEGHNFLWIYYGGKDDEPGMLEKALRHLDRAIELGNYGAIYRKALFLKFGRETENKVEPNIPEYETFLSSLLAKKDAEILYDLAIQYWTEQTDIESRQITSVSNDILFLTAENGFTLSQKDLGKGYEFGWIGELNYEESFKWYKKAAKSGDAEAQWKLGLALTTGRGVKRSVQKAVKWFEKSAGQDYADGHHSLGVMYATGAGIDVDYDKALEHYQKAISLGGFTAYKNIAGMYYLGQSVEADPITAKAMALLALEFRAEGTEQVIAYIDRELKEAGQDQAQKMFKQLREEHVKTYGEIE